MFHWLGRFKNRVLPGAIFLICLFLQPNAFPASEYCAGNSEIDSVPSFINQIFLDALQRSAVAGDQRFWGPRLEDPNRQRCRSANPSSMATECEWQNAAQIVVEIMGIPDSTSRNGPVGSNSEFVTALYRILLRRAPDAPGFQSHLGALNSGSSRQTVAWSFLISEEYRKRFACRQEIRRTSSMGGSGAAELGVNGHPFTQPVYSDTTGVSFDQQLKDVQELGAKWYRFDLGAHADLAKVDELVKKAQQNDIELLPVIFPAYDPAHDSLATLQQNSYKRAFEVVNRYKTSIHVWELANELDNTVLYKRGDPGWFRLGNDGDQVGDYNPQNYARVVLMLRALSDGIRAADGSALRIINFAGWLHTGFIQRLEDDHVPYDIVGVHWYQDMGEITCPGQSFPCPEKPQHFNVIQRLQTITHGKPLWMTETNYRALASNSTEANRARADAYLAPTLERYLNSPATYPFRVVMIYELLDEVNLGSATERECGLFSVERQADGRYAQANANKSYRSVQRLLKR